MFKMAVMTSARSSDRRLHASVTASDRYYALQFVIHSIFVGPTCCIGFRLIYIYLLFKFITGTFINRNA